MADRSQPDSRTPAWVVAEGRTASAADGVLRALRDAGVEVRSCGPEEVEGGGVLLVSEPLPESLPELVGRLSDGGQRRVIVAAVDTTPAPTSAWRLLEAGAADVVTFGEVSAAALAERLSHWATIDALATSSVVTRNLVGASPAWRTIVREVVEIAQAPGVAVLVSGESGTGKELVARLIHTLDPRDDKGSLVVVDCATIVPELSGSEFFGHERGAYTGAVSAREGAFALADRGTLFLDEVGELPLDLQAELLRVIQEGTYKRVGSNRWARTRFRLVCATNRDLVAERGRGSFRTDLYFRLAAATVQLPSLHDRPEDVLPLARSFLAAGDAAAPDLDPAVRDFLVRRDYPGNVRDLEQLVARIRLRHVGPGPITIGDIPPQERPAVADISTRAGWPRRELCDVVRRAVAADTPLRELLDATREAAFLAAVEQAGSVRAAARALGVTDRTLQLWRKKRRALEP